IPFFEQVVFVRGGRFLFEKDRAGHAGRRSREFFTDEAKRVRVEIFDQARIYFTGRCIFPSRKRPGTRRTHKSQQVLFVRKENDAGKKTFGFRQKRKFARGDNAERTFAADKYVDSIERFFVKISADVL